MATRGSDEHLSAEAAQLLRSRLWQRVREDYERLMLRELADEAPAADIVRRKYQAFEACEGIIERLASTGHVADINDGRTKRIV